MATKRKAEKRVPNYPSFFDELTDTGAESLNKGSIEARRSRRFPKVGKWKGKEKSSRERRNTSLWESLYPTRHNNGNTNNIQNTENKIE